MNSMSNEHAGLTTAQHTVQTVLLIVVTLVGTWLGVHIVPWQVSWDPCLVAAVATVVIVTCLWLTRRQGLHGATFERYLLAGFLVYMALVYVMRYLFASPGKAESFWLWIEVLSVPIFAALAWFGMKRSPWLLAVGITFHGVAWDSWHYRNSTYIPDWYVIACFAADVSLGAYVAARVPTYRLAARNETRN